MRGPGARRAARWVALAGLALAWAGWLCRGRDGDALTQTLAYGTPWLARLAAGILAMLVLRRWWLKAAGAAGAAVALVHAAESFAWREAAGVEDRTALSVSVWNAARRLARHEGSWPALADADVSAVVEAGDFSAEQWRRFQAAAPGHQWQRLDASTMIGVRGGILGHRPAGVHDRFRCHRITVELPGRGIFTVVVADLRSQPWLPREPSLQGVLAAAADDPRAIVLGDFNTPPEARGFRPWRERGFVLANDAPRRGFRETWAHGLPLLTLDHIWVAPGWRPLAAVGSRHGSDHARVRCVVVPAGGPARTGGAGG